MEGLGLLDNIATKWPLRGNTGVMGYTWRWFFVEREITKPF
jgi:hypothetical protein